MRRNCAGVRAIKLNPGDALAALLPAPAAGGDDLLIGTEAGVMLRVAQAGVPAVSRATKGVKIVKLGAGDAVATVTALKGEVADDDDGDDGGDGAGGAAPPPTKAVKPKKAPTAYFAFCAATRPDAKAALPPGTGMAGVSKELGARWRALPEAEKKEWGRKTADGA